MSSKLRKLKQQAYEAGRKRDWAGAADAYAQILELDKNNPSSLNEYGDVCLKAGDQAKAIRQFLAAAGKYKQNGLLNNAQAVYKKVLRHDPDNLNANWFLAEIRAEQGLVHEGEKYALTFLARADDVSGEIKEIFHKRCLELFEFYAESDPILEKVEQIFRVWDMVLEAARVGCLRACLAHRRGEGEQAVEAVATLISRVPELINYAEYTRWQRVSGEVGGAVESFADVNTIDLGGDAAPAAVAPARPAEPTEPVSRPAGGTVTGSAAGPGDEAQAATAGAFAEILADGGELAGGDGGSSSEMDAADGPDLDREASAAPTGVDAVAGIATEEPPEGFDRDEDGCISIDLDGETSFADLAGAAAEAAAVLENPSSGPVQGAESGADAAALAAPVAATSGTAGSVNLLDEILAEEGEDILRSSDSEQVSTIASEIGRNLGDAETADPQAQYDQGMVYLEMGLNDQAALAFRAAAADPEHALRAREMWGVALRRDGRFDEAVAVLQDGLTAAASDDRAALGLRYHAGRTLEELGRADEAQEHYRRVHAIDAGFADVAQRLRALVG